MNGNPIKEIILVDDESGVLLALKLLLSALGFTVQAYADPEEALKGITGNTSGHLILSDLRMPKLDGIQLLIEAGKVRPDLPFVLMSGHATKDDVDRANANGSKGFLAKPFTPDQLKALIATLS